MSATRVIGSPITNIKERGLPQPGTRPGPHLELQDWEKTGSLESFPLLPAIVSISRSKTPKPTLLPGSRQEPRGSKLAPWVGKRWAWGGDEQPPLFVYFGSPGEAKRADLRAKRHHIIFFF